jgi:hypothetical protein
LKTGLGDSAVHASQRQNPTIRISHNSRIVPKAYCKKTAQASTFWAKNPPSNHDTKRPPPTAIRKSLQSPGHRPVDRTERAVRQPQIPADFRKNDRLLPNREDGTSLHAVLIVRARSSGIRHGQGVGEFRTLAVRDGDKMEEGPVAGRRIRFRCCSRFSGSAVELDAARE